MKSREGTVVDADDLMQEMVSEARRLTIELGKITSHDSKEAVELYNTVGMGALKYFLLKVDPGKRMLFNPDESIDFNGHTGPFIQYSYARIRSVLRKAKTIDTLSGYETFNFGDYKELNEKEKELVKVMLRFPDICAEAIRELSPAVVANYVYELSKSYNQFYHDHPIVDTEHAVVSMFRLSLSNLCGNIIATGMKLLGITVPERM
jgi:arginyl-tRNA synthetase